MNALEIRGLTKRRGDFALQGLDLTLPAGCIMGLIGENGAGKSTAIRLILNGLRRLPWQTDSYHKRKRIANRIFTFILKGRCYYADSDSPYFSAQPAQDPYQPFFLMGGGAEWKLFSKQSPIGSSHC